MPVVSGFPFDTSGWPTSGGVTAANSGLNTVTSTTGTPDFYFGSDDDGTYIEDRSPVAGSDHFDVIALGTAAGELADGGTLDFVVTMKLATDGTTPADFAPTLTWFSNSTLIIRHAASDYSGGFRLATDGVPNAIRMQSGTGTARGGGSTDYTFIPTDTLFEYRVRIAQTNSTTYAVTYFVNDEPIAWDSSTDLGTSGSNKGRIVRIRGIGQSGAGILPRYYGFNLVKNEPVERPAIPTTSRHYRPIPVPVLAGTGQWDATGTVTLNRTLDQSNDPDGYALAPRVPQTRAPMATLAASATLQTVNEMGSALPENSLGGSVIRFPLVWLSDSNAICDLIVYAEGTSTAAVAIRLRGAGTVQQGTDSGFIAWSDLLDESGDTMAVSPGEVYEAAVHFTPGKKPRFVLHARSLSITAAQTLTSGAITTSTITGLPSGLGDIRVVQSGISGTVDFGGAWLQTYQWAAGFSSFTHTNDQDGNPSYFGASSRIAYAGSPRGGDIGWGQEIPGFAQTTEYIDNYSAIGRSGSDLADFEANNPAWSDLLAYAPCLRIVAFESIINHIATQRQNGAVAIAAARAEAEADFAALVDACKASGVRLDFVKQWPNPDNLEGAANDNPGDSNNIELPPEIGEAVTAFNAYAVAYLQKAGRRDLFTVADPTIGRSEGDFFVYGSASPPGPGTGDVIHYTDAGETTAYIEGLGNRTAVGGSDRENRDRSRIR